jgi:hypothetical protein
MSENDFRPEPSPTYLVMKKEVDGHEFTAGFYPGFARSIDVNGVSVYEQKADGPYPFVLASGSTLPWSTSAVELTSDKGYVVTLHIDDPEHVVEQVVLRLRDPATPKAGAGGVAAFQGGSDLVTINETPVLCPPFC